jgi:nitroreductase
MDIDEVIKGRRSVRTYKSDEVGEDLVRQIIEAATYAPRDLVRQIIEAATYAPSAKNGQQWRFTVLTGESKDKFTDLYRSKLNTLTFDGHDGRSPSSDSRLEYASIRMANRGP